MSKPEMTLTVPGNKAYVLVVRTALSGVALLKDLDAGTLDDLRMAADEACDCLLHQGHPVEAMTMEAYDEGEYLRVRFLAKYAPGMCPCADETEIALAVLQTLAADVEMDACEQGCIRAIDLVLRKATAPLGDVR